MNVEELKLESQRLYAAGVCFMCGVATITTSTRTCRPCENKLSPFQRAKAGAAYGHAYDGGNGGNHVVYAYLRRCVSPSFQIPRVVEQLLDSAAVQPIMMKQNSEPDGAPVSFYGEKGHRRIAAEIEVAHTNGWTEELVGALTKWNCAVVHDGSLQMGEGKKSGSFEINTAPASGSKWKEMISEVAGALRRAGGRANWSCGTHIHIDATKNFGWWDMRNLVQLYGKIEDGLFAIIDPSRKINTYSQPCGIRLMKMFDRSESSADVTPHTKIRKFKESISMGMYGVSPKSLALSRITASKSHSSRYMALNLHSWFYRGTVEFRHSHGITQPDKIVNWGRLCASVIDAAASLTDKELAAVPAGVPGLVAIAPTEELKAWIVKREKKFKNFKPTKSLERDDRYDTEPEEQEQEEE